MFGAFQTFGKLGAIGKAIAAAWSPLALWPDGVDSPGMWIDPSTLSASFNDYLGTTPVAAPGSVADSANPVGLALDIRAGATAVTDPGHHMLQATSSARPLESARVNLLTYTEDFSFYQYSKNNVTTTGKIITTTGTDNCELGRDTGARAGGKVAFSTTVKKGRSFAIIASNAAANGVAAGFDGTTGAYFAAGSVGLTYSVVSYSCVTDTDPDFWSVGVVFNTGSSVASNCAILVNTNKVSSWGWSGCSGIGDTLEVGTGFQYQLGGTVSPYQPVLADTTYTSTGITPFQLYDGVDDGMATASFTAGTLINGMDCMIPVRRDSTNHVILGPYNAPGDLTKYLGNAESGYDEVCYRGAGSPTVWVDGTQTTHGWASELYAAVTVGDWHIVELRGLDLSAWLGLGVGSFGSGYNLNGARGDIMLYPSTASTEDKDKARQYLADKYGVTLA